MKKLIVLGIIALAGVVMTAARAEAFTSKTVITTPISVSSSGVTATQTLTATVVQQNTADVPGTVSFGTGGNTFRDSGAALKVTVDTNLAAYRIIIYTSNLATAASPKFCENTALGNDGGGLVGVTDCKETVPMVWAISLTGVTATPDPKVFTGTSSNLIDYSFTANPSGPGATNAVFITDRAHVATFTTKNSTLDNQLMKNCVGGTLNPTTKVCTGGTAVTNTAGDGLYPQFFGTAGQDSDLYDTGTGAKIAAAEELSKNIAVVAFGCAGAKCNVPNIASAATDDVVQVTGPFYLPIGADFRTASAQSFGTNQLTLELITQ